MKPFYFSIFIAGRRFSRCRTISTRNIVVSCQCDQTHDRTVILHAIDMMHYRGGRKHYCCGTILGVHPRCLTDQICFYSRDLSCLFRLKLLYIFSVFLKSIHIMFHKLPVIQSLFDNNLCHRQSQCAIRTRKQFQVQIRLLRRYRLPWIHSNDVYSPFL